MARIRTIKPEAFKSESLSEVPVTTERTFFGLLTQADDEGRIKDGAAVLNGALWPLRPEHTVGDMEDDLNRLEAGELLCRYDVCGRDYMHLPTWKEHQRINRPTPSKIPPCPHHDGGGPRPTASVAPAQAAIEGAEAPGQSEPQHWKDRPADAGTCGAAATDEAGHEPVEVPSDLSALSVDTPAAFAEGTHEERSRQAVEAPEPVPAVDDATADADTRTITSGSEGDEPMAADVHPDQEALAIEVPTKEEPPKTPAEQRRQLTREIVTGWWEKYGTGQSQKYPAIFKIVDGALANGVRVDELTYALDVIGQGKKPVSGGTIQFALSQRPQKDVDAIIDEQAARRDVKNFSTQW